MPKFKMTLFNENKKPQNKHVLNKTNFHSGFSRAKSTG